MSDFHEIQAPPSSLDYRLTKTGLKPALCARLTEALTRAVATAEDALACARADHLPRSSSSKRSARVARRGPSRRRLSRLSRESAAGDASVRARLQRSPLVLVLDERLQAFPLEQIARVSSALLLQVSGTMLLQVSGTMLLQVSGTMLSKQRPFLNTHLGIESLGINTHKAKASQWFFPHKAEADTRDTLADLFGNSQLPPRDAVLAKLSSVRIRFERIRSIERERERESQSCFRRCGPHNRISPLKKKKKRYCERARTRVSSKETSFKNPRQRASTTRSQNSTQLWNSLRSSIQKQARARARARPPPVRDGILSKKNPTDYLAFRKSKLWRMCATQALAATWSVLGRADCDEAALRSEEEPCYVARYVVDPEANLPALDPALCCIQRCEIPQHLECVRVLSSLKGNFTPFSETPAASVSKGTPRCRKPVGQVPNGFSLIHQATRCAVGDAVSSQSRKVTPGFFFSIKKKGVDCECEERGWSHFTSGGSFSFKKRPRLSSRTGRNFVLESERCARFL